MANINDDLDEFDSLFDDHPLDPEFEQSLAQVEATYTASQMADSIPQVQPSPSRTHSFHHQSKQQQHHPLHQQHRTGPVATSTNRRRRGSFVPPLKKPRLETTSVSRTSHASKPGVQPSRIEPRPDEVIVRNLKQDDFVEADDSWWQANHDLEHAEQEAIRMSQQYSQQFQSQTQSQQTHQPPQPNPSDLGHVSNTAAVRETPSAVTIDQDVTQLYREIERLKKLQKEQEEMVRLLKVEKRAKEGEVAVVRQNLSKLNAENTKLREQQVSHEQQHKVSIERMQSENQRQLEMLETATAFRRVEQDTSRRVWPSSVRRLAPTGLKQVDRRQEAQVAAGLTTPTKRNRYVRSPFQTPTKSPASPHPTHRLFASDSQSQDLSLAKLGGSQAKLNNPTPKPKDKPSAFPKFQNSFSHFPSISTKMQALSPAKRQRISPTKSARSKEEQQPSETHALQPATFNDPTNDDSDMPMMDEDVQPPPLPPSSTAQQQTLDAKQSGKANTHQQEARQRRKQRYLWAVAELIRRRAELIGHILGHSSPQPAAPLSHPPTKYNVQGCKQDELVANSSTIPSHESTLHRLFDVRIPSSVALVLRQRYANLIDYLLTILAQASVADGEEQLRFLLDDDQGWEDALEDGMIDMYDGIAAALQTMMGIFVRLCMVDYLTDVLRLTTSLCISHPRLAEKIIAPQENVWNYKMFESVSVDSGVAEETESLPNIPTTAAAAAVSERERIYATTDLDTPRSLTMILVEAIRKCNSVPIAVSSSISMLIQSHKSSAIPGQSQRHPGTSPHSTNAGAVANTRPTIRDKGKGRQADTTTTAAAADEPWEMGCLAREQLVEAVIGLLEMLAWTFQDHPLKSVLSFVSESPGFLYTLLDRQRHSGTIKRIVRLMANMAGNSECVHGCLSAQPDPELGHPIPTRRPRVVGGGTASTTTLAGGLDAMAVAKFPILEVLSKHLVDRRFDLTEPEWHGLHGMIIILFTQAALRSSDTLIVLASSAPLLAALVKCLSLDSDELWVSQLTDSRDFSATVDRLAMDIRLLSVLYQSPVSLAQRLGDQETYSMLNGIRQSFIVAISRIAFAPEPEWLEEARLVCSSPVTSSESNNLERLTTKLEAIADLAGDLVDLVLLPDETDSIYEILAQIDPTFSIVQHQQQSTSISNSKDTQEMNNQSASASASETEFENDIESSPPRNPSSITCKPIITIKKSVPSRSSSFSKVQQQQHEIVVIDDDSD